MSPPQLIQFKWIFFNSFHRNGYYSHILTNKQQIQTFGAWLHWLLDRTNYIWLLFDWTGCTQITNYLGGKSLPKYNLCRRLFYSLRSNWHFAKFVFPHKKKNVGNNSIHLVGFRGIRTFLLRFVIRTRKYPWILNPWAVRYFQPGKIWVEANQGFYATL